MKLRMLLIVLVLSLLAGAVIVRWRDDGSNRTPEAEPKDYVSGMPSGWERCWRDNGFTIAYPAGWTSQDADSTDACRFADPDPSRRRPGPDASLRIVTNETVERREAPELGKAANYPEAVNSMRDETRWEVISRAKVYVPAGSIKERIHGPKTGDYRGEGLPSRVYELEAKGSAPYPRGTRLYAYVIANSAQYDARCGRYFVFCGFFLVVARADPGEVDRFDRLKDVTDHAVRTLRFYVYEASLDARFVKALKCFLRARAEDRIEDATRCASARLVRVATRGRYMDRPGNDIQRFTLRVMFLRRSGIVRYVVRTYRGSNGRVTSYSEDLFELRGKEPPLAFRPDQIARPDWRVVRWRQGREVAISRMRTIRIYLPRRGPCKEAVDRDRPNDQPQPTPGPDSLVSVERMVPAADFVPKRAIEELFMGPLGTDERNLAPISIHGFRPESVHIDGSRADVVTSGDDGGTNGCKDALRSLAVERTLKRFPQIREVSHAVVIAN